MKRLAIVGASANGALHRHAIIKNENTTLTAVCDIIPERAEDFAKGTGANIYTDYKKMQENEELDGVILNLPHFLHKEVTIYFLEHKVPVLIEKPMAISTAECDAMMDASVKNSTPLAVGHVQKYLECYRKLKEIISSKTLGTLCHITEVRNCDYFSDRPKWFLDKKLAGAGMIMNYGAHTLDKIFYTTGCKIEDVAIVGNNFMTDDSVEASSQMLFRLSGNIGASCTLCGCRVHDAYETHFYFTNGEAKIERGTYLYISKEGQPYEKLDLDYEKDYFSTQMEEFIKFLDGKESEIVTPEYGRAVIEALEKATSKMNY